jgi:hypothetical protein
MGTKINFTMAVNQNLQPELKTKMASPNLEKQIWKKSERLKNTSHVKSEKNVFDPINKISIEATKTQL